MSDSVIIVGAGHAGTTLAFRLRKLGFQGQIELIGQEPDLPYQRPLLSKKYLLGESADEDLHLKNLEQYHLKNIRLRLSCKVTEIDADRRLVRLSDDTELAYRYLVLATGSRARVPEADWFTSAKNVHVLRTVEHARTLRASWRKDQHLLIVGGGYVGLEAAAVARALDMQVTLIERSNRILSRVACEATSDVVRDLHLRNGVRIFENTGLDHLKLQACVEPDAKNRHMLAHRAHLSTGQILEIDQVLIGIGAIAEDSLARSVGLVLNNGIAVDAQMRSSNPDILAIGDCASMELLGQSRRLESVPNAIEMANVAAQTIVGNPKPYRGVPWFWSDQYDLKLQIAGINTGHSQIVCTGGSSDDAANPSVCIWYFQSDRLIALDAFNDPRAFMLGRRWIESDLSPCPLALSDKNMNLQTLVLRPTPRLT
ncbi:NAD(P)/FAD-dependent oxidoreductase [Orrella sp. 11846]|uniref:NAD(P)/FAD-dependent oxidoreductase n=1 Tax=Orrella sp. 11846 TaxID=3409913 RepID=UPI003B5C7A27